MALKILFVPEHATITKEIPVIAVINDAMRRFIHMACPYSTIYGMVIISEVINDSRFTLICDHLSLWFLRGESIFPDINQ